MPAVKTERRPSTDILKERLINIAIQIDFFFHIKADHSFQKRI